MNFLRPSIAFSLILAHNIAQAPTTNLVDAETPKPNDTTPTEQRECFNTLRDSQKEIDRIAKEGGRRCGRRYIAGDVVFNYS